MKAREHGCEEASVFSQSSYIPCNKDATKIVYSKRDKRSYRMCAECALHAETNRGMKITANYSYPEEI